MDTGVLIALLAGDGILASMLSSTVTWLLTRRKYNTEVDKSNIENMKESLDFYIQLSDDYKQRLASEIESHNHEVAELKREIAESKAENADLKRELREQEKKFDSLYAAQQKEISMMKNQMLSVYSQVCLNFKCLERTTAKPFIAAKPKKVRKENNKMNNETV